MGSAIAKTSAPLRHLRFVNKARLAIDLFRKMPQISSEQLPLEPEQGFQTANILQGALGEMLGKVSRLPDRARFFCFHGLKT